MPPFGVINVALIFGLISVLATPKKISFLNKLQKFVSNIFNCDGLDKPIIKGELNAKINLFLFESVGIVD